MQKIILYTFILLFVPFVIINAIAFIMASIWLVSIGEGGIILIAIGAMILSPVAYVIAFIPAMPIILIGAKLLEMKKAYATATGHILLFAGALWTYALMVAWTIFVFTYSSEIYENRSIPHLLLAYVTSTAAFSYMASKEDGSNNTAYFACYLSQLSSLFFSGLILFSNLTLTEIIIYYIIFVLVAFVLGAAVGVFASKRFERLNWQSKNNSKRQSKFKSKADFLIFQFH